MIHLVLTSPYVDSQRSQFVWGNTQAFFLEDSSGELSYILPFCLPVECETDSGIARDGAAHLFVVHHSDEIDNPQGRNEHGTRFRA